MTHKPTTPTLKMRNPKTWQVIRRARVLLQTHGWTKGVSERRLPTGNFAYCAVGATHAAHPDRAAEANRFLNQVVQERGHDGSIISFNDGLGRTKAEVIGVFREAENRAKALGK